MHVTAKVRFEGERYLAECEGYDVVGDGATAAAAVESLRHELVERVLRPNAVAPPSHGDLEPVVVDVTVEVKVDESHGPQGPGEA